MTGWLLAFAGTATALLAIVDYGLRVRSGDNPRVPIRSGLGLLAGTSLGLASLAAATPAPLPFSLTPLAVAAFALAIHAQRRVPTATIRVSVGDALIPFSATTPEGTRFHSDSLRGRRVLLKFFRGEWCPFCQAELRRFDAMEPELRRLGIEVVALSKDPPADARRHRERDGLRLQLLCDPDLTVIRRYGLEHRKALQVAGRGRVPLFGLSVGLRPSFESMAAPTTLLVDERGVIRWIDQTDDYKVRSNTERVRAAIHEALGIPLATPRPTLELFDEPDCVDC